MNQINIKLTMPTKILVELQVHCFVVVDTFHPTNAIALGYHARNDYACIEIQPFIYQPLLDPCTTCVIFMFVWDC
jgi:hypothetical protein